jgi:uncharacterized protein
VSTQGGAFQLPEGAAWRLVDAHDGFEVLFPSAEGGGIRLEGQIAVVEEGEPCGVRYSLHLDGDWTTRSARVVARSPWGEQERLVERAQDGSLAVDGEPAPQLEALVDVDLEGSAVTNALPVNRMRLDVGESAGASAAYVRLPDLRVVRLDQTYRRIEDEGERTRYEYDAPEFETRCVLVYDAFGLVLDYPGIAKRVL